MKTVLFSLAAMCVANGLLADTYSNVFTGIVSVDESGVPTAEGATWNTSGVSLANVNGSVEFDTGSQSILSLDITSEPADTNTVVRLEFVVTVEEVDELFVPEGEIQTAFAVHTNAFNVWNGQTWVVLDEVPAEFDGSSGTNLLVELSYQGEGIARKVRFTIGDYVLKVRSTLSEWVELSTDADNVSGLLCAGSGTITSVNGSVMLGVASYDGVKYGSLAGAVAAAQAASVVGEKPVEVLRETAENVTLEKSGVVIADNGKTTGTVTVPENAEMTVKANEEVFKSSPLAGKSGEYEFTFNVSGGNVSVELPASMGNKEVSSVSRNGSLVKVVLQTARSVLAAAKPDGNKSLSNNIEKLRKFLEENVPEAYSAADVSAQSLSEALSAEGANKLPLYQSYALGISPSQSVKPVSVEVDNASEAITLKIPALSGAEPSGDYDNIKFVVSRNDKKTISSDADNIAVPLETGSYSVKIVFE